MEHETDTISKPNKWEGKVSYNNPSLDKATVDQLWPLFTDFFNIHKWLPGLDTCHGVHGNSGEPGCIRYCSSRSFRPSPSSDGADHHPPAPIKWARERLMAVDHEDRVLVYEVLENNIGFESYVATMRIVPEDTRGEFFAVEWSFAVDPIEGWSLDGMSRLYEEMLQHIVNKMKDSIANLEQINIVLMY